jgi:hypothetical protein
MGFGFSGQEKEMALKQGLRTLLMVNGTSTNGNNVYKDLISKYWLQIFYKDTPHTPQILWIPFVIEVQRILV